MVEEEENRKSSFHWCSFSIGPSCCCFAVRHSGWVGFSCVNSLTPTFWFSFQVWAPFQLSLSLSTHSKLVITLDQSPPPDGDDDFSWQSYWFSPGFTRTSQLSKIHKFINIVVIGPITTIFRYLWICEW